MGCHSLGFSNFLCCFAIVSSLDQHFRQFVLPVRECLPQLALNEERIGDRAQKKKSYLVFDYIAYDSSVDSIATVRHKLVPMMPAFERPFFLHIREVMVPLEFSDAGDPPCP